MSVPAWNRPRCDVLASACVVCGVPVTVITYGTDVAPHLQRGLMYRRLRMQRRRVLHQHQCQSAGAYDPHGDDSYDPYGWAKTGNRFKLLADLAAFLLFAAGTGIRNLFKSSRGA